MKLNKDEFLDLYNSIRKEHPEKSQAGCYEFAETLHEKIFKERRYADYNSFKRILCE